MTYDPFATSRVDAGRQTYADERPKSKPTPTDEERAASGVLRGRDIYTDEH
ncbi:hypothetical protein [Microbacterium arborescens]|uniref:hypothetical protein n=1 Tax=Microbacterium arborescens TaxID=33883 RepID=UPI002788916E|nr:hypothetical protein [Microbacterium arborescens]MDQ1217985.1 hypothetical protein [Microbacterium arborescens]